jgi:hypothetical protein
VSADPAIKDYLPSASDLQRSGDLRNASLSESTLKGQGGVYNSRNLAPYAYSQNQPITARDPDGKAAQCALAAPGGPPAIGACVAVTGIVALAGLVAAALTADTPTQVLRNDDTKTESRTRDIAPANTKTDEDRDRGRVFERVVSAPELDATAATGLLRGGRSGENYFTDRAPRSLTEAEQTLALPPSESGQAPREFIMKFRLLDKNQPVFGPSPVGEKYGQPGGGTEYFTLGPTPIEVIETENIKP